MGNWSRRIAAGVIAGVVVALAAVAGASATPGIGGLHSAIGTGSVLTVSHPVTYLGAGSCLTTDDQVLVSADGAQALTIQPDGNLVLYPVTPTNPSSAAPSGATPIGRTYTISGTATWATMTSGTNNHACFQTDGNFVVYNSANSPLWFTHTNGIALGSTPAALVFGTKSVRISAPAGTTAFTGYSGGIWSSAYSNFYGTSPSSLPVGDLLGSGQLLRSPNGSHTLRNQADGNLVVYNAGNTATWWSGTNGTGTNFVGIRPLDTSVEGGWGTGIQFASYPFNSQSAPVWTVPGNNTWNTNGITPSLTANAVLTMQDDGNLVLYNSAHQAIWASNTAGQ